MPSNHLILCCPLLLSSIFPSIRVFSNESVLCTRWPKYWSFSYSISPSNEYSVLVSFSIDWFDLLAVQGTLQSLLQHHNSKASIFQHSALFMVQLQQSSSLSGTWLSDRACSSGKAWAPCRSSPGPRACFEFLPRAAPVRALVSGGPAWVSRLTAWGSESSFLEPSVRVHSACVWLPHESAPCFVSASSAAAGLGLLVTGNVRAASLLCFTSKITLWSSLQHVRRSLYWLSRVAISKHRRLAGLQNRHLVAQFLRCRWQQVVPSEPWGAESVPASPLALGGAGNL